MTKCFHEIGTISLVKILEKYNVEAMWEWSFPYEKDVSHTHTHTSFDAVQLTTCGLILKYTREKNKIQLCLILSASHMFSKKVCLVM